CARPRGPGPGCGAASSRETGVSLYSLGYIGAMSLRLRLRKIAALLLATVPAGTVFARADEVTVFAAASLADALGEVGRSFEASSGHHVAFNFGGSNDLARQIEAGAPAELFLSADRAQMDRLEKA